jgi:hypothetical protein
MIANQASGSQPALTRVRSTMMKRRRKKRLAHLLFKTAR